MIKATIKYNDGTVKKVKKKSILEMAMFYEQEREHGATEFYAAGETGAIKTEERNGKTLFMETERDEV